MNLKVLPTAFWQGVNWLWSMTTALLPVQEQAQAQTQTQIQAQVLPPSQTQQALAATWWA